MGRNGHFLCVTCKVNYYLGYGSYSSWLDTKTTSLNGYDILLDDYKGLRKNMNFRSCLVDHEQHDWIVWNSDWAICIPQPYITDADNFKVYAKGYGPTTRWIPEEDGISDIIGRFHTFVDLTKKVNDDSYN